LGPDSLLFFLLDTDHNSLLLSFCNISKTANYKDRGSKHIKSIFHAAGESTVESILNILFLSSLSLYSCGHLEPVKVRLLRMLL